MQNGQVIPVDVDGTTILVEATVHGGDEEISGGGLPSFTGIGSAITKIAREISSSLETIRPRKATVEFSCEIAVESGALTALIVNGSGSGSITVTLEWGAE